MWRWIGIAIFLVLVGMVVLTYACARVTINVGARDATQSAPVSLEDQDTVSIGSKKEEGKVKGEGK